MKSHVTSDGKLAIGIDGMELARLRAFTRTMTGIEHPTMDDVKALALAAHNAFCGEGCRYPKRAKATGVEFRISLRKRVAATLPGAQPPRPPARYDAFSQTSEEAFFAFYFVDAPDGVSSFGLVEVQDDAA